MAKRSAYRNLTVQVLCAVAVGVLIGAVWPETGAALKPLMDGFIRLIKMVVGPVVFLTIVVGVSGMGELKKAGRVGLKALVYFEVVTTVALAIGLVVANVIRPGAGMDPSAMRAEDAAQAQQVVTQAHSKSGPGVFLNVIPDSFVGALTGADMLQLVFLSVLVGFALASLGARGAPIRAGLEHAAELMFRVVGMVVRLAPLGALGAMAYTVGTLGVKQALVPLMVLMACVYLTMGVFIFGVLGLVMRMCGVSLWRYLVFIRREIVLVLGTSSSESALPRMIERMEMFGCGRGVVGMVIPAGYSFNLDGTSIYLSMAVLFIAQAYHTDLGLVRQLEVLGVLMLMSKGAAAVTGGGFITLSATLSSTRVLPPEGVGLVFGVDRFMSEARAITNLIGNGVAAVVVSRWEGEFDEARYRAAIAGREESVETPEVRGDLARAAE